MKKILFVFVFIGVCTININAQTNKEAEIQSIKKVIITGYVEGIHNEGNLDKIDQCFHPAFDLLGLHDGLITHLPIYTWKEYVKANIESGKLPKGEGEKRTYKFPLIDVTGTAAIAVIELYEGETIIFTDYLSLYKFNDGWKIVGKIYYRHPKEEK